MTTAALRPQPPQSSSRKHPRRAGWGRVELPAAVSGARREIDVNGFRVSYYAGEPEKGSSEPPLLLIHSVNAAAAAHEVRPLYEHYRPRRPVYAIDLPGYGFSERRKHLYTPRLMTDAVQGLVTRIRGDRGHTAVDAIALSLSCEFLARAALERPGDFRSLGLVAPTGFNRDEPTYGAPESTRGRPRLHRLLTLAPIGKPMFNLLTSRRSVRFFLEKTWGGKGIDEHLLEYSWRTARQRGAHFAPFCFLSGFLFSADINRIYESLAHPVWMVHGVRGDFTDYRLKRLFEPSPNWRIEVFQTGALPHFEAPEQFTRAYDAFLARVAEGTPVNPKAA